MDCHGVKVTNAELQILQGRRLNSELRAASSEQLPQSSYLRAATSEQLPQSSYLRAASSEQLPQSSYLRAATSEQLATASGGHPGNELAS